VLGFWIIKSESKLGFSKLLRSNYPTNQIELIQILINGGVPTKLIIKDLSGDTLHMLQILWDKDIIQKDLRLGIRIILAKLKIPSKIELAVMSIYENKLNSYEKINRAVDIIEPDEQILQDKITKWRLIKSFNDNNQNIWQKYDKIDPKYLITTDKYQPYNVIREFGQNSKQEKTIEVTIWTPKDVSENIENLNFERFPNDIKLNKGKIKLKTLK
jgi:hypothetical protein